ncbi:hypothetical protein FJTKL_11280 [Diaporthe vaccinii]|uniref:Integral membrane protein n=1 Tax=Diaporthe vaccinii TaxID=105482 RepID=A0ABR4EH82_9PEZI
MATRVLRCASHGCLVVVVVESFIVAAGNGFPGRAGDSFLPRTASKLLARATDRCFPCALVGLLMCANNRTITRVIRELIIMTSADRLLICAIGMIIMTVVDRFLVRAVEYLIIMTSVDKFRMRAVEMIVTVAVGMFLMCAVEGSIIEITVDGQPVCAVRCFVVGGVGSFLTCATDSAPLTIVWGFVVLVMNIICTNGGGELPFRLELLFHAAVIGLAILLQFNVLLGFRNLLLLTSVDLSSFKFLKKRLKSWLGRRWLPCAPLVVCNRVLFTTQISSRIGNKRPARSCHLGRYITTNASETRLLVG